MFGDPAVLARSAYLDGGEWDVQMVPPSGTIAARQWTALQGDHVNADGDDVAQ
jgi:hypothetical protein